jgi:uncharacterized membrane protein
MNEFLSRRWPLFLLASLALNCLLIGLVAGHSVETPSAPSKPGPTQPVQVSGFGARVAELPQPDKRAFMLGMRAARPEIAAARADLAAARQRMAEAITRDPYDKEAAAQAFAEVRRKTEILQERVQEAAARALAGVSLDGRRSLVK